MNLRVAHNGEDREMDVVEDGMVVSHADALQHARTKGMTASIQRAIQRDPNPNGLWKRATVSEDGVSLVTDRDGRTYVLTVREV